MKLNRGTTIPVLLLGLVTAAGGCGPAVAAGAIAGGAAAGLAYSERGAQSYVKNSVQQTANAAVTAMRAMKITIKEREPYNAEEKEIEIKGKDGSKDVVVDIEGNRDAGRTRIEVTVSDNVVNYHKGRADEILRAILERLD